MKRSIYFLKTAFENFQINRLMAFFSLVSLSLTLMLFGFFLLFYYNVQNLLQTAQEDVQFSIYLYDAATEEDIGRIKETLSSDDRILSFHYISKHEALELFNKEFRDDALLKTLGGNPLPASFEVKVKVIHQDPKNLAKIVENFQKFPGVEEVQYGSEWLKNINTFLNLLKKIGVGIGSLLAVTVMAIIANTIRLHFYNRKEEIEIMKLIGASHGFIKIPFFLEGSFLGMLSGALSVAMLFLLFYFSEKHFQSIGGFIGGMPKLRFLPTVVLSGMIFGGGLLGGIGSFISLSHLLKFRESPSGRKQVGKKAVWLLVSAVLCGMTGSVIAAEKLSTLNQQIQKERKELEKLKEEIETKREKNIAMKKREESILSTLEEMDDRLRLRQKEAVVFELKIKENDAAMEALSQEIGALKEDIREKGDVISNRIRAIYRERQNGSLKMLFVSQDYMDFLRRFHYLKTIARKEGEMLSLFKKRQAQLEDKNEDLAKTKRQLSQNKETLAHKLVDIRAEKKRKDHLLARVRNERSSYEKALAELDESSLQLQTMLQTLEQEKKRLQKSFSEKFSKERGRLNWPNDGAVVSLFGRQKHPKFDTYIYKKGIEIETSRGEEVRAVHSGVVQYANWFRGYGMVIIIDHGENYYSIYAHLAKLLVSVGETVLRNKPIGQVGETGLSQGNNLYFEIRHQGEPMDPLAWLQKRR